MTDILLKVYRGPEGPVGPQGPTGMAAGGWTYRNLTSSDNYVLTAADARTYLNIPTGSPVVTVVLNLHSAVALPVGAEIWIANQKATDVTLARFPGVLLLKDGTAPFTDGNVMVARKIVRIVQVAIDVWVVS